MKNMLQVAEDAEMCWVVGNLEIKLDKAKLKNPNFDLKEQETIVRILKQYRENNLGLIQDFRTIKNLHQQQTNKSFVLQQQLDKYKAEYTRLKAENDNLKESLKGI